MKRINYIIIGFLILLGIGGCDKEPTASFTTDKSEYIAGDVVHMTNTSTNGYSFLWTLPNGSTSTSSNVDYLIDTSAGFATLNFTLQASDKDGDKNMVSKSVSVIPESYFLTDNIITSYVSIYKPTNTKGSLSGNNWLIYATVILDNNPVSYHSVSLSIYLPGPSAPTSAHSYSLQSNYNIILPSDTASIYIEDYTPDAQWYYHSVSGQLEITIENGMVHAVFNNIYSNIQNIEISGNIYCP